MTTLHPVSISRLNPEDLTELGFDISQINQEDLGLIQDRMANAYAELCYWEHLEIVAEILDVPKL